MATISSDLVRAALRIEHPDDDAELVRLTSSAVAFVEGRTGRRLSLGVDRLFLDLFDDSPIVADPFFGVDSVVYLDPSGAPQTLSPTAYRVTRRAGVPWLSFLAPPSQYLRGSVEVAFAHGYSVVPPDLVQAVLALVGAWWNNPEALQPIELRVVPFSASAIIDSYRIAGMLR